MNTLELDLRDQGNNLLTTEDAMPAAMKLLYTKFIPKNISIILHKEQNLSERFWHTFLNSRLCRLSRLNKLIVVGINDESALGLRKTLHGLSIVPRQLLLNDLIIK